MCFQADQFFDPSFCVTAWDLGFKAVVRWRSLDPALSVGDFHLGHTEIMRKSASEIISSE